MYTFEAGAKLVTPFIIGTGNGKPRLELLYSTQPVAALVGRELNLKRTKMHNDHFFCFSWHPLGFVSLLGYTGSCSY